MEESNVKRSSSTSFVGSPTPPPPPPPAACCGCVISNKTRVCTGGTCRGCGASGSPDPDKGSDNEDNGPCCLVKTTRRKNKEKKEQGKCCHTKKER